MSKQLRLSRTNEHRVLTRAGRLCYKLQKSDYGDDGAVVMAKRIAKNLL